MTTALVLGGGGVTGIAWETGLLAGLAAAGVDLTDAGLVVGTSAGSVVASRVCGGIPLEEMYEAQVAAVDGEVAARLPATALVRWGWAALRERDAAAFRARVGRLALAASTAPESERLAVIAHG